MVTGPLKRSRLTSALLLAATIVVGLGSRKFSALLPPILAKNAGDILYATMTFWLVGFLFPTLSPARAALAATLFCFGIEFLKFVDAPWLVAARNSWAGALVFGHAFQASNLVCYGLGALLGAAVEVGRGRRVPPPPILGESERKQPERKEPD